MTVIQTERCELKSLSSSDQDDVLTLYLDETVRKFLGGILSEEEFPKKFQSILNDKNALHFVVRKKSSKAFIGLLTIDQHHNGHDHEISYQISSPMHGKGYAVEAVQALIQHAFTALKFTKLVAETQSANAPSIKLLERLGFTLETQLERFGAMQSIYIVYR